MKGVYCLFNRLMRQAYERNYFARMHRVQKKKLFDDEEQKNHYGEARAFQVLQVLPKTHETQRGEGLR